MVHLIFQFHIPAADYDGVVDIGAHLDRADHQIAQEKEGRPGKGGNGEVNPDTALNYDNQQYGHPHRLEGEQQHQQHD